MSTSSISRRMAIGTGLALGLAPSILRAQARPPAARTVRGIMHGDVPTYDPIWTTANMSAYHGAMVYDTLFGLDEGYKVQPQMVEKFGPSDDKLTWNFQLRDGLKFHDGTAVTSADVVASIRRWAVRSGAGQLLMQRTEALDAKDDRNFAFRLKEPFPLIVDILGSTATPVLFIMRKKEAETDPMQKIDTVLGSGPFVFNQQETRPGSQYVYDRNANYAPRAEAASGMAGGKVVKIDRAIMMAVPDSQTAMAALQSGEADMVELPPIDFLDQLAGDPDIALLDFFKLGVVGYVGINWLHPPFNNVKVRQALQYVVKQEDMLRPTFVSEKYYRTCGSWFTCGSPMESEANNGWFKTGQDFSKAKQLMREGGYDGRPVVVLQATNIEYMRNAATVMAQAMRDAGFNVDLQPMDWANVVQRRANKAPPEQGGWNIFFTSSGGLAQSNPYLVANMAANGDKAWFGWPSDEPYEQLRDKWLRAGSDAERKEIANQIQARAWEIVPHMYFGQWKQPMAHRKNVRGWLPVPEVIPFWNLEKTGNA